MACLFAVCLSFIGCQDSTSKRTSANGIDTMGISSTGAVLLQGQVVVIPPPALLSGIIRKTEIPFNANLSASSMTPKEPVSEFELALQLGIYGADLSYLVNYDRKAEIALCLSRIRSLAERLDLMNSVDSSLISDIEKGLPEPGALVGLHSDLFRTFEQYLRQNNRPKVSNGILIGGWIESLHQLAELSDSTTTLDPQLAEQRYSAYGILQLAKSIDEPAMAALLPTLTALCDELTEFDHRYQFRDPMHDKREHITYLRSESVVEFTPEQMETLHELIMSTRNQILVP
ncbi:MAG: hypothetical protein ACK478_06710 [Flavobacteriales bacterium]